MKRNLFKRAIAVILSFVLVMAVTPMTSFAEDTTTVTSEYQLKTALEDDNVKYIHIASSFSFTSDLDTDKTIIIDDNVSLSWEMKTGTFKTGNLIINGSFIVTTEDSFVSRLTVCGPVENNGTVEVRNIGKCLWRSPTTGSGNFIGTEDTYIDYGVMPEQMLPETCKINIMKDFSLTGKATITLEQNDLIPGNTVTPSVSNLIDGVDIAEVFKFTWKNPPVTNPLSNESSYTIPASMSGNKLQVSVSCKPGYAMVMPSGTLGTITSEVYIVGTSDFTTFYVDELNGSNSNVGTKDKPLQTISYALNNIDDNGTIILMNDYYSKYDNVYMYAFSKNITVKSSTNDKVMFVPDESINIDDGVTATFENIDFGTSLISITHLYSQSDGTGNVVFNNSKGSMLYISDVASVTAKSSDIGGSFKPSETFSLINSSFSGSFSCNDFESSGDVVLHLNSSSQITNSISVENGKPVAVEPPDPDNGFVAIKLPDTYNSDWTSEFEIYDSVNGRFTLKLRNIADGPCLVVTEKAVANSPFHIAFVPEENGAVSDGLYIGTADYYCAAVTSAVWSGYSDTEGKTWQKGDIPELTVVLTTDFTQQYTDSYYFDEDFDPSGFILYNWADIERPARYFYKDEYVIGGVEAVVKPGQGASNDGRNFTFTLVFPEIGVTHSLIKISYKAPTCTENGNIEYWYCSDCGKYFSDAAGTKIISKEDTVIPSTGHKYKYLHHFEGSDGTYLVYSCTVCKDEHQELKETVEEGFNSNFNKLREDVENGYLYDVNYDGHINSRDYAIIEGYHKIS